MSRFVPSLCSLIACIAVAGWARAEPVAADQASPTLAPPVLDPKTDETSWTDDWSILPVVFYSPETDFGFGFAVIRSLAIPEDNPSISTVALGVIYTTKGQLITRLEPDLRFGNEAFVNIVLRYQRYPTRYFDPAVHPDDPGEPFDENSVIGHIDGRVRLTGQFRAGLRWEYRYNEVGETVPGGALEQSGYPGLGPYFSSGVGPVISFDSRDEPRLPTRGLLLELRALGFADYTGSSFSAVRVDAELRGYIALGNCHVLAGEVLAQVSSGDLPFQLLPRLGGSNHLRGWYEGHLRNRHAFLAQLEWRFPIVGRVGGAAFAAIGETVPDLADVSLDRLRVGAGLGLRYLLNQRQNVTIRLDLAYGSGFGAYFDVLEAF